MLVSLQMFAQFADPKISPQEKTFDFGDIKQGEIVTHKFVIFNKGGDLLKISKVKASCGCTAADPTKTELAPNDSTSILVKFNTKGRRGKQRKNVYIFSNDPQLPQLRLSFTANIIPEKKVNDPNAPVIKLSKSAHNFGNVKEGDILDLEIVVKNTGKSLLEIKKVKSSCGCTAALLSSKRLQPNESGKLKIEFDTKNLSGTVARTVTLYSNDQANPAKVITLIANIEKEEK